MPLLDAIQENLETVNTFVLLRDGDTAVEQRHSLVPFQESVGTVTQQHLQAHVRAWAERGVISKWAVPEIRFVDLLEKTSVGKLDKKLLRQKHG